MKIMKKLKLCCKSATPFGGSASGRNSGATKRVACAQNAYSLFAVIDRINNAGAIATSNLSDSLCGAKLSL
jgi:hypothetical protein